MSRQIIVSLVAFLMPLLRSQSVQVATAPITQTTDHRIATTATCPNQGGLLDSISVAVGQPLTLFVHTGTPAPSGGWTFQVRSDNPSIVAAGDRLQGFLPTVVVPAGQQNSNAFTVFGTAVGQTTLRLTNLTAGGSSTTPMGAWDVNQAGNLKFADANPPWNSCLVSGSAEFSTDASVLSRCGTSISGVASDGVTQVLLRTISGLPGTACFSIGSSSALDQGSVRDAVLPTQSSGALQYGFTFYSAPAYYGDSSTSRTVTINFSFTPNIGNGNTTSFQAPLTIVRPPVMLLHGLWSSSSAWSSVFNKNDGGHVTFAADYSATAGSNFSVNAPKVQDFISSTLNSLRSHGYAATQVDVIAHSMGGILTRLYALSNQYRRPDNFNSGDVRRLISLDTPHKGSSFANLLVSLHQAAPLQTYLLGRVAGDITQGAVCDLAENSPALQGLASTQLPSRAITGTGGPFPSYLIGFEQALTSNVCVLSIAGVCLARAYVFPQDRVNGFRFSAANDGIVGLASQQGGLNSGPSYSLLHFGLNVWGFSLVSGVTNTSGVASDAFSLLDGPSSSFPSGFAASSSTGSGTPFSVVGLNATTDASDYKNQCLGGGPMNPNATTSLTATRTPAAAQVDTRVRITAPSAGQTLTPGTTLNITVQVDASVQATDAYLTLEGIGQVGTQADGTQFQGTQIVPSTFAGPLTIIPVAVNAQGNLYQGAPVTVAIAPAVFPEQVAFAQRDFYVPPTLGTQQLHLMGLFAGGSQLDLTSAAAGTVYTSSNPSVVAVTADGLAQIVSNGTSVITGTNGTAKDYASFVVQNSATIPPQDRTGQFAVQSSGLRLDRTTGFFVQTITVTNSSLLPIPGPLYLVILGLPSSVTLVNKSGATTTFMPGSSFLLLPIPNGLSTIAPGGSVTQTLQFLNPNHMNIAYSTAVVGSVATP